MSCHFWYDFDNVFVYIYIFFCITFEFPCFHDYGVELVIIYLGHIVGGGQTVVVVETKTTNLLGRFFNAVDTQITTKLCHLLQCVPF